MVRTRYKNKDQTREKGKDKEKYEIKRQQQDYFFGLCRCGCACPLTSAVDLENCDGNNDKMRRDTTRQLQDETIARQDIHKTRPSQE